MYGTPLPVSELPEEIDWEAIIKLAKIHAVLGIIIDSIQFLPERQHPSGPALAKMNKFALGLIQANTVLENSAAHLVTFLKQHGVNGVLLKGQGVARSYYRIPQMRHSGDIDFYVGKATYKKAVDLCLQKLVKDRNTCHETEQHFDFLMGGVPIELHRLASRIYTPSRNKRFQAWTAEQLEHSANQRTVKIGNTDVNVPSYDFDAIFIFYHAWRHFIMGGIGLRQLCDWALIFHTHAGDIDTAALEENISRFGMTKGWKLFACIAVTHLGVPHDKMPLYDPAYCPKSEKILIDILAGGSFGYYSKAVARTPIHGHGLWHGLGKVRNITEYFLAIFPIIPVEATFLTVNRLFSGTISAIRKPHHKPDK